MVFYNKIHYYNSCFVNKKIKLFVRYLIKSKNSAKNAKKCIRMPKIRRLIDKSIKHGILL